MRTGKQGALVASVHCGLRGRAWRSSHLTTAANLISSRYTSGTAAGFSSTAQDTSGHTRQQQQQPPSHAGSSTRAAAASATATTTRGGRRPANPMELLHGVFQSHPSALRLHHALMISLAAGNAEEAADLAAALAQAVQRACASDETVGGEVSPREENLAATVAAAPPEASADDLAAAVEVTQRAILQGHGGEGAAVHSGNNTNEPMTSVKDDGTRDFWRDPGHLCVTLLESAFETELPADLAEQEAAGALTDAGNRALRYEEEQMAVLDEYLAREADRWKSQKNAVAKVVLEVARRIELAPIDLHAAEDSGDGGASEQKRLNALRHANVVIRGEVPSQSAPEASANPAANDTIEEQLAALKERMAKHYGKELTPREEQMARYELTLASSTMRYVVGLHRDVRLALDKSDTVTQAREEIYRERRASDASVVMPETNAEFFIQEVLKGLHPPAPLPTPAAVTDNVDASTTIDEVEALTKPVVPFTFMLKCCLWFNVTEN